MADNEVTFLSHIISEQTPLYGGEKFISLKQAKSIQRGDSCNTMLWSFLNHTGTHADAPLHFIKDGLSLTDFEPEKWIFKSIFLIQLPDIPPAYIVTSKDISDIEDCELLLIKTDFEKYRGKDIYWQNSPGLHPGLADWLKQNCPSLRAVGVDFISISNLHNQGLGRRAHKSFLGNKIILIEDMKLSALRGIPKTIIAAPLLVERADGAPCTVLGVYN